jgi:hypothetical protein
MKIFDKKILKFYSILLVFGLVVFSACSEITGSDDEGDGDDGENGDETVEYALSVSTDPSEGGSVDPSEGTYEEGEEVEVTATPADGWEFVEWTGDISSTDNPLSFSIEDSTEITANFSDVRSEYAATMTVADAEDQLELEFGQDPAGSEMDEPAPPDPPEGALNAYFERSDEQYFKDYESNALKEVDWDLYYQPGSGEDISLSWEIDSSQMDGTLSLQAADETVLVEDMSEQNSFDFTAGEYDYLIINYLLE